MEKAEKRRTLIVKYLQDRNLKISDSNIQNMKGTNAEFELRQIYKANNCL